MQNKLKRATSFILASLLTLSTTFQASAIGIDGNGGGESSSDVAIPAGEFGTDYKLPRIGLRLSVVRKDDPTVMLMPDVIDIMYMPEANASEWYNSCGFKYTNNWFHTINDAQPERRYYTVYDISKAMNADAEGNVDAKYIAEHEEGHYETNEYTIPRWMNYVNGFKGRGAALHNWFIKNEFGKVATGDDANLGSQTFDSTGNALTLVGAATGNPVTTAMGLTIKAASETKKTAKKVVKTEPSKMYTEYMNNITGMANRYWTYEYYKSKDEAVQKFNSQGIMMLQFINLYVTQGKLTQAEADKLKKAFKDEQTKISNLWTSRKSQEKADSILGSIGNIFDKIFNVQTVYAATPENNTGESIPPEIVDMDAVGGVADAMSGVTDATKDQLKVDVTDEGVDNYGTKNNAYIKRLFLLREDGKYLFSADGGTTHISQMTETDSKGNKVPIEYVLVMEPIVIFTPTAEDGVTPLGFRFYGTLSNLAEHWGEFDIIENHLNTKAFNIVGWSAMTLSADFSFGNTTLTVPKAANQVSFAQLRKRKADKEGWGLHLYWGDTLIADNKSSIPTWDEAKYPTGLPGPAPDATSDVEYPPEPDFKELSKKFNIAKWYYIDDEMEKTEEVYDVQTRENTPHTVAIINEGNRESEFFWEVEDWQTGKDKILPADGDTNTTYEEFCNKNKGSITANGAAELELKPTDPDQVLYIKLVLRVMDKETDVVKVYEADDGTSTIIEEVIDNRLPTYDAKDPNAVLQEWNISSYTKLPIKSYNDVTEEGSLGKGTSEVITIPSGTQTIYIHYKGKEPDTSDVSGLVLHENEISHKFTLHDIGLAGINRAYEAISEYKCPYTWTTSRDNTRHCRAKLPRSYTDSSYSFTVSNSLHYDKTWVYAGLGREFDNTLSETASNFNGFTSPALNANMEFVINRSYADKVTMYPKKNDAAVQTTLADMGVNGAPSYIPVQNRYGGLTETADAAKKWTNTFTINFVYSDVNDPNGEWVDDGHGYGHAWSEQSSTDANNSLAQFNSFYSKADNTELRMFLGKASETTSIPERSTASGLVMFDRTFASNTANYVTSDYKLSFYPYVKMLYDTLDNQNQAYITSNNLSKIPSVQNIDVGVHRTGTGIPLYLSSYQWSTHAKTQKGLQEHSISDRESVLPGGALYQINGKQSGKTPSTFVGVRTFETVIPDENKEKLADMTGVRTVSEAKSAGSELEKQINNALEQYQLVQFASIGIEKTIADFLKSGSLKQVSGTGSVKDFGGNALQQSDAKYYLKTNGSGASRADLDVLGHNMKQTVYTISSDVDGNVSITKDGGLRYKKVSEYRHLFQRLEHCKRYINHSVSEF